MRAKITKFLFTAVILLKCESAVIAENHAADEITIGNNKPGQIPVKIVYEQKVNSDRVKREEETAEDDSKQVEPENKTRNKTETEKPLEQTDPKIPEDTHSEPDIHVPNLNLLQLPRNLIHLATSLSTSMLKNVAETVSQKNNLPSQLETVVHAVIERIKMIEQSLGRVESFIDVIEREVSKLIEFLPKEDLVKTHPEQNLKTPLHHISSEHANVFGEKSK